MGQDRGKRNSLKQLGLLAAAFLSSWYLDARGQTGHLKAPHRFWRISEGKGLDPAREHEIGQRMRRAKEEDAAQVEALYSTKPISFRMGKREYVVPVNYFTPKGKNESEAGEATDGFGFFIFLPDFGGYTKENWKDPFDRRRIYVFEVRQVDKNAVIPILGGGTHKIEPAGYGEPQARFVNRKRSLEAAPSFKLYGLDGYRSKGSGNPGVTWTGTRSNGEFFFFESTLAPEERIPGVVHPNCQAQYYSGQEDLFVAYRYSQDHIAKWREIDDAIWTKLHSWQVRSRDNK